MFKKKFIFATSVAALLASSSSVLANTVDLNDNEGTFYCEVKTVNPLKTVDIDTSGVTVKGFCAGQKYVTQPGHIQGMPMHVLKKVYFEYKQDGVSGGSVNVIATNTDDIECQDGKGENRKAYSDADYC